MSPNRERIAYVEIGLDRRRRTRAGYLTDNGGADRARFIGIESKVQMRSRYRHQHGKAQRGQRADHARSHPAHRLKGLFHANTCHVAD